MRLAELLDVLLPRLTARLLKHGRKPCRLEDIQLGLQDLAVDEHAEGNAPLADGDLAGAFDAHDQARRKWRGHQSATVSGLQPPRPGMHQPPDRQIAVPLPMHSDQRPVELRSWGESPQFLLVKWSTGREEHPVQTRGGAVVRREHLWGAGEDAKCELALFFREQAGLVAGRENLPQNLLAREQVPASVGVPFLADEAGEILGVKVRHP